MKESWLKKSKGLYLLEIIKTKGRSKESKPLSSTIFHGKNGAGFTLIELLLVIAIIGLLSTLIVVFVMQAKAKAQDGSVKAHLSQVRKEAASIYNESNSYNGLCKAGTLNEDNSELNRLEEEIMKRNGQQPVACYASTDAFCAQSPLASGGSFCIDSVGRATSFEINCSSGNIKCSAP